LGAFFEKKEKDMTLSQVTSRFGIFASAAIASSFLVAAVPVTAAASAPHYKVELAQPLPAPKNKMVKGSFFRCAANTCTSTSDASSAKNMCTWVAREFGEVKSFQAGNRALTADELAKCNKK
jgi:curli biogenesis system outer membrane secretion channel CsgG